MGKENEFRSISHELADAVGVKAADIQGKSWEKISEELGFENAEEIGELLNRQDTWSGKTVLWPVAGTDLCVPIDLAGLPSYGRDRVFEGFNGFGIIRMADSVIDPDATGLKLADQASHARKNSSKAGNIGFLARSNDNENSQTGDAKNNLTKDTVVDLDAERDNKNGRSLTSHEQETFEEIGEKLTDEPGRENEASVEENRSEDAQVIENSEQKPHNLNQIQIPQHDVDTSILARLPVPVLVYRDNELLFGNQEFFKATGFESLVELADAGGVDVLFRTTGSGEDPKGRIYHADGSKLNFGAHLQRVPWDENRAMLLTLRNSESDTGRDATSNQDDLDSINPRQDFSRDRANPSSFSRPRLAMVNPSNPVAVESEHHEENRLEAFGGLGAEDLRSILDTATDGVIILSDEGIVRAINRSAEALFDVKPDQVLDQTFTKLLAPESHRSALDYISGMTGTGVASILNDGREVIGKTSNGGLIPLFMTIGKLQKTDACCAVVRDITHWKKAEEELVTAKSQAELASDQKSEFLAKISHEIRTPLNAIIGFSDIMIEERFGKIENDRYRGYLRDIHRSGNHMLELINDLLDISKIEAGKMDLEFDACDLNTIITETVALTQPEANKERVIIRTSLSSVVPKVVADPRSLRQIILNLVSNSIKYTKPGGQVIVSTVYDERGEVVLRVRDTGIGMSEIELAKALKPFQQIDKPSDSGKQGTGLGLPLTKAMVLANRAEFQIESTPDEGTMVEIHFPSQRVLADR